MFRARLFKEAEDKTAPLRRQYEHYEQCICGREFFAETRHLGAFEYFFKLCKQILSQINDISLKASNKSNLFGLYMNMINAAAYIAVWVIMFFMVLNKQISIGAFAAVLAALDDIRALIYFLVAWNLPELAKVSGPVENYIAFMDLPETGGNDDEIEIRESIIFDNVSFSYPGVEQQAVSGVSFQVNPKETIAIVGENGSGKTTLMRLLMGIYKSDVGSVRFDDKDIADYSPSAVSKNISAVFQRYMRYQISLSDNIAISRYNQNPDKALIEKSVQMAGVDIQDEILTDGYDTILSREFGGVDISGGQWQRLAIARGYYREHSLIVLDEPTSAIDPLEETKIYERFVDMSKDKTAFIVTHRLGSVRRADRIFVMDKGKLAESGTHDELMANGSIYANMYNMQKMRYE